MIRGWTPIGGARATTPPKAVRVRDGRPVLAIMARAPRLGQGKSRLAKEIGRAEAWRINRALQALTLARVIDSRWRVVLVVTPDNARTLALPEVWPRGIERRAQGRGDLGARMARAARRERRIALIGTDCPGVTRTHIAAAFRALTRRAVAIGPTEDGGFWIFAARRGAEAARAFAGVRWSSADTLSDVLGRLGREPAELVTLRDVDVAADWRVLGRRMFRSHQKRAIHPPPGEGRGQRVG